MDSNRKIQEDDDCPMPLAIDASPEEIAHTFFQLPENHAWRFPDKFEACMEQSKGSDASSVSKSDYGGV